VLRSLCTRQS